MILMQNNQQPTNVTNSRGLLTIVEVARVLSVHPNTVRRWANEGLFRCYRIGVRGDRRFSADEVERFIESGAA